ncbi:glycosyltransferase [Streptococcus devriesei]|uniref:glycosyltransferase n=1 Tax=Streptococcus devriesei TaxID=231233 RepID=UPI00040EC766|nr:glycosyltransferase [Streptococcus devriesei]
MDNFLNTFFNNIDIEDTGIPKKKVYSIWNNLKIRNQLINNANDLSINAIILVKDQEQLIQNAIASADKISDCIYVYDTGSKDKTIEVVKQLQQENTKIVLRELVWENNFALMRNKAANLSSSSLSSWNFFIDSDEQFLGNVDSKALKLTLSVLDYLLPEDDICLCFKQTAEDSVVVNWAERLYKNTETINFYGYVHEEPRSLNLIKIKTQFSLYNSGRSEEQLAKFNKEEKYYKLLQKNIAIEPDYIKWYALLPFNYGINHDKNYFSTIENIYFKLNKLSSDSKDTFFEESLVINYVRCLIHNYEVEKALQVLSLQKENYRNNTSIIYLYYLLKNIEIMENAREQIAALKKDVSYLQENKESMKWVQYQSTNILEDIMAKLLFKCEEYDLAKLLIENKETLKHSLLEKEIKLTRNTEGSY